VRFRKEEEEGGTGVFFDWEGREKGFWYLGFSMEREGGLMGGGAD
jgi:hypothetical protein